MHQPAGRVVDEDQQRAGRPAVLEPAVLAAVDLHQLAQAVAAVAGLVDPPAAGLARHPQAGLAHPLPQRLARQPQVVGLGQLLGRERRAEVGVALAHDRERGLAHRSRQAPVARPAAPARGEAGGTLGPEPCEQAEDLPPAQPQERGGLGHRQLAAVDAREGVDTREFRLAHQHHRHPAPPSKARPGASKVTLLSCRALTSARCGYMAGRFLREVRQVRG